MITLVQRGLINDLPEIKTLKQEIVADYLGYRNGHLWWIKSPGRRVKAGDRFGSKRKDGRIGGQIFGKYYLEHRLIWFLKTGEWPTEVLDHKDGLNNDPSNLRQATNQQNQFNRGPRKNKSSIYKGVCKHKGRWYVQYRLNGKNHSVGYFDCEIEAAKAYDNAVREHQGEFMKANFNE